RRADARPAVVATARRRARGPGRGGGRVLRTAPGARRCRRPRDRVLVVHGPAGARVRGGARGDAAVGPARVAGRRGVGGPPRRAGGPGVSAGGVPGGDGGGVPRRRRGHRAGARVRARGGRLDRANGFAPRALRGPGDEPAPRAVLAAGVRIAVLAPLVSPIA